MAGIFDEPDPTQEQPSAPPPAVEMRRPGVLGPAVPTAPIVAIPADDPSRRRVIIATPPTPRPEGNIFDEPPPELAAVPPDKVDWSKLNQPTGELRSDDPSFTEQVIRGGQDVLESTSRALGGSPDPYNTRRMAEKVVGLSGFTPIGGVLSAGDAGYNLSRGNYGKAALDTIGVIPTAMMARRGVQALRGELPMIRTAATPARTVDETTGAVDDELKKSASKHYFDVATAPIDFMPGTLPKFTDAARVALQLPQHGSFTPEATREVHDLLTRWASDFGGRRISTPHDFDVLRQQLRAFGPGPNSAAGEKVAGFIDKFLSNPPPPSILRAAPGALDNVRRSQAAARGDYRAYKTSGLVEQEIDTAGTKTGRAHSGLNLDNTTRQRLDPLITPNRKGEIPLWGATYPEQQAIRDVVKGDYLTNKLRLWGNRLGGGGGIGQSGMSYMTGSGATAGAGLLGADPLSALAIGTATGLGTAKLGGAIRGTANERTVQAARDAVDLIRRNSPLYRSRAAASPDIPDPFAMQRDAIAYALIPQIKQKAQEEWDQSHVPYQNRGR